MTHKGTVALETERLLLRRFRRTDAKAAFNTWAGDPEVTQYLRWDAHESVKVTRWWLSELRRRYAEPSFYEWGIRLKREKQLIGSISAFESGYETRWEVGYCIGKAYWNQGYTTEALKRVLAYLSEECGIKSFRTLHAKSNPASGAVMTKAGFRYMEDGVYRSFDGAKEFESRIYYLDL
jgi:ribosomal-protein-alanine N-acetyltransferase